MPNVTVIDMSNKQLFDFLSKRSSKTFGAISKSNMTLYNASNKYNICNIKNNIYFDFTVAAVEQIRDGEEGQVALKGYINVPTDKNKEYVAEKLVATTTLLVKTRKKELVKTDGEGHTKYVFKDTYSSQIRLVTSGTHGIDSTDIYLQKTKHSNVSYNTTLVKDDYLNLDAISDLQHLKSSYGNNDKITTAGNEIDTSNNFVDDSASALAANNALSTTTSIIPVEVSYNTDLFGEINVDYWTSDYIKSSISSYNKSLTSQSDNMNLMRGIFGLPYQFLPTTDMRINNTNGKENGIGLTYGEKILARMPLLFITPGTPTFASINKDKRKDAMSQFLSQIGDGIQDAETQLSSLLDGYEGKFYTMDYAYAQYYNYVNPMCRMGAIWLNLHKKGKNDDDLEIPSSYYQLEGTPIKDYNWSLYDNGEYEGNYDGSEDGGENNTGFETSKTSATRKAVNLFYYKSIIPFYINSDTSFSENISNETAESTLSTTINGFSDKARELQFILGTANNVVAKQYDDISDALQQSKEAVETMVNNISKDQNNIFSTLVNNVRTIVQGGRLIFPNIWSNSSFSKSYEITIRLTTPYTDRRSWWLNIYVPLCHLITLALPKGEYANGYTSPFLVKAFYKGMFNIDMGIITDMSISKGKEGSWTKDGLPTVVEVRMTIQDLYSQLSMTPAGSLLKSNTLCNISEMDYLANLCGVNINEPDLVRMMEMFAILNVENVFSDILPNIGNGLSQLVNNWLFRGFADNNLAKRIFTKFS